MKNTETLKKYRAMKRVDLVSELKSVRKELNISSLKLSASKMDTSSDISKMRKNIARIKTILGQKESGENNG